MHSLDDVIRTVGETGDNFYMTAFMLEAWLGRITNHYMAAYSEHKQAKDRNLQQGFARQSFDDIFKLETPDEVHHVFASIARFAEHRDAQPQIVFRAFGCMNIDFPFPSQDSFAHLPPLQRMEAMTAHARAFFSRLADWVEADIHLQTHVHTWNAPHVFDPDPVAREIASVGLLQRHYAGLSPESKAYWRKHFEDLATEHGSSPHWIKMGEAMANEASREPHHPEIDQAVIRLWPLVSRHNWTYRDLMTVLHEVLPTKQGYPCDGEQALATYCSNVLGLRKGGKGGRSVVKGELPGLGAARAIYSS